MNTRRCNSAGHFVYMQTDGRIHEIVPNLKVRLRCGQSSGARQRLDNLARVCNGKICVDLDLDRQMFPFCSPTEIDEHVHEAVLKLGSAEGCLWLRAEIDDGVPLENVEATCSALSKYTRHFSR